MHIERPAAALRRVFCVTAMKRYILTKKGGEIMRKIDKKSKVRLVLDIVSYVLSTVSLGLSVAAFVISLVQKNEK